jgi:hypothetical protein
VPSLVQSIRIDEVVSMGLDNGWSVVWSAGTCADYLVHVILWE